MISLSLALHLVGIGVVEGLSEVSAQTDAQAGYGVVVNS